MTVSAGVAEYPHPSVNNPYELVKNADQALYQAKGSGRNRVIRGDKLEVTVSD